MKYDILDKDTFLYYELCGDSLGNSLYELKGENTKEGERGYRVILRY
jgi:hypothetical protein